MGVAEALFQNTFQGYSCPFKRYVQHLLPYPPTLPQKMENRMATTPTTGNLYRMLDYGEIALLSRYEYTCTVYGQDRYLVTLHLSTGDTLRYTFTQDEFYAMAEVLCKQASYTPIGKDTPVKTGDYFFWSRQHCGQTHAITTQNSYTGASCTNLIRNVTQRVRSHIRSSHGRLHP